MDSTFKYRVLKSSWGIAIDVTARFDFSASPENADSISDGIHLVIDDQTLPNEYFELVETGVNLMSDRIKECDVEFPLCVRITELKFNPCDFQPCGIPWAVAGWITSELEISPPAVSIEFDKTANCYVYDS
jgi:hypothetical protein